VAFAWGENREWRRSFRKCATLHLLLAPRSLFASFANRVYRFQPPALFKIIFPSLKTVKTLERRMKLKLEQLHTAIIIIFYLLVLMVYVGNVLSAGVEIFENCSLFSVENAI